MGEMGASRAHFEEFTEVTSANLVILMSNYFRMVKMLKGKVQMAEKIVPNGLKGQKLQTLENPDIPPLSCSPFLSKQLHGEIGRIQCKWTEMSACEWRSTYSGFGQFWAIWNSAICVFGHLRFGL
jgi:hypothetical protein